VFLFQPQPTFSRRLPTHRPDGRWTTPATLARDAPSPPAGLWHAARCDWASVDRVGSSYRKYRGPLIDPVRHMHRHFLTHAPPLRAHAQAQCPLALELRRAHVQGPAHLANQAPRHVRLGRQRPEPPHPPSVVDVWVRWVEHPGRERSIRLGVGGNRSNIKCKIPVSNVCGVIQVTRTYMSPTTRSLITRPSPSSRLNARTNSAACAVL
jgi:hypothetical protein